MLILSLILYRFHIKKIKSELLLSFGQIILKALMSFDRTIIKRQPHGGMICVLRLMKTHILDVIFARLATFILPISFSSNSLFIPLNPV